MNIFGNCTCPACDLDTRFLLELGEEDSFYLLGDTVTFEANSVSKETECDYCQHAFLVHVVVIEDVISAFLNQQEYALYENGELKVSKAKPKEGIEIETNQELKQFHQTFYTPFSMQPFNPEKPLTIEGTDWNIHKIFKKEGVEKELNRRLLSPTLDEYWYEIENHEGVKKWCVVTDTENAYDYLSMKENNRTISEEVKRITYDDEWYEFANAKNDIQLDEEREHNAILILEPPFLKENEKKFDVTDTQFKTHLLFDKKLSENLTIRAYQYLAGVRLFVYNREGEMEMDVFSDTAEEALDQVQEQYSISAEEL